MRVLVRTQFDGEKVKEKERNPRPDTLIREMVEAVMEQVGRGEWREDTRCLKAKRWTYCYCSHIEKLNDNDETYLHQVRIATYFLNFFIMDARTRNPFDGAVIIL